MKFTRRTNTIILWVISIGLLLGMIITFTPTLGRLGGQRAPTAVNGQAELVVNGATIYESDVSRARQNPLFTTVTEGQVGKDLDLLLTDELIQQQLLSQASAKVNVSNGEVSKQVDSFRKARGVDGRKNDQAYLNLIGGAGFNDQTFRDYLRQQLRESAWQDQLTKDVSVSDAEVQGWYETHPTDYQSEERITAREIVVDDADLAASLQKQAVGGADFAQLAKDNSKELADRGGALGAAQGSSDPQPVGRPALPTAVATAAFGLQGPGITDVVSANGRFYVVKVESYEAAATRPLDEVRDQVKEDALNAKKAGVVQAKIDDLRKQADISVPDGSSLSYDNHPVATVGDATVTAAELDRATYTNPQIQQALSPQSADLITQFFKPAVLGQLIDTEVAYQGSKNLDVSLVGSKPMVAQAALNYVSRDASATADELKAYYDNHTSSYTIPAEAVATRVDFTDQGQATAFHDAVVGGTAVDAAAKAQNGTVQDLGTVQPGQLTTTLDTALFKTDAFSAVPGDARQISDVLVVSQPAADGGANGANTGSSANGTDASGAAAANAGGDAGTAAPATTDTYVVLLATRTPERTRSFDEVQSQVKAAVLAQKKQELRTQWLDQLKKDIQVKNLLAQAGGAAGGAAAGAPADQGAQPADGAAAAPGTGSGAAGSGNAGSGAAGSGAAGSGAAGSGAAGSGAAGSGAAGSGNAGSGAAGSGGAGAGGTDSGAGTAGGTN